MVFYCPLKAELTQLSSPAQDLHFISFRISYKSNCLFVRYVHIIFLYIYRKSKNQALYCCYHSKLTHDFLRFKTAVFFFFK